jgi:uncharacterized protein
MGNTTIKKETVLITGGSGLVGRYLTSTLLSNGFNVSHLSRNTHHNGKIRVFRWDPEKEIIDPLMLEGVDYLIHLAGANIGEKQWTKKRKEEIVDSRVDSAKLLQKIIADNEIHIKAFISASATGYYGLVTSEKIFTEEDLSAEDFIGSTCSHWEKAADLFANMGIRTVKIRTAVVLEKSDSALSKLMIPSRFGFLVQMGDGNQYMPWIHINDLCNIYLKAITDQGMWGAYNAVSPNHITHKDFIKTLARKINKRVFPIAVPSFILRAALGEMSYVILKGSRISPEKIINSGYRFLFNNLEEALSDLITG